IVFRFGLQQSCITPECSARRGISPSHLSGFRVTVRWQDLTRTSFQKEIDKAGSLPGTGGDCQ
ncbi:TPA: hypothetical protein ACPVEB_001602, partial [Escherichia coli]